ncbi:MAG: PTH1 family peptidyl-tRNA hydrolase [Patiriisocius sp.]|jgi:PTH1 family peptidyl-tRNA hydrolase
MKFLIVGLGNIGAEYHNTRHNIGFDVLDELAKQKEVTFTTQKLGDVAEYKFRGKKAVLLKPSTFMNLSGKAIRYWMDKEKIPVERLLVIVDDLALPFGKLRLRAKGSDAGHNGLKSIEAVLQTSKYPRLKFGIGDDFQRGQQVQYVLGRWTDEQLDDLGSFIDKSTEYVDSVMAMGVTRTMGTMN